MDGIFKAALTAAMVLLVMAAARRGGRRFAGLVAALPTITAPTLAWLAHEEGVGFAISAAVGSVAACGMLAVFAVAYARAAQCGRGTAVALVCALCGGLVMALPAKVASAHLADALALAFGCCVIALALMPNPAPEVVSRDRSPRGGMLLVALVTGAITAVAALVGPSIGGFATGLLSSLPFITGAVAMAEHSAGGPLAASHFLRGYVSGLFSKAVFGAAFALLAAHLGAAAALLVAAACVGLLSGVRPRQPAGLALPAAPARRPE